MSSDPVSDKSVAAEILASLRLYVEKRFELFRLKIGEQVSLIVAESIQRLIGILLMSAGLFIAWLAFGFYLSDLFGSQSLGFLAASIPLIIIGMIFMSFRPIGISRRIQASILNDVMRSMDQIQSDADEENESSNQT